MLSRQKEPEEDLPDEILEELPDSEDLISEEEILETLKPDEPDEEEMNPTISEKTRSTNSKWKNQTSPTRSNPKRKKPIRTVGVQDGRRKKGGEYFNRS